MKKQHITHPIATLMQRTKTLSTKQNPSQMNKDSRPISEIMAITQEDIMVEADIIVKEAIKT